MVDDGRKMARKGGDDGEERRGGRKEGKKEGAEGED